MHGATGTDSRHPDVTTTATTDAIEESPAPHAGLQPDKTDDESDHEPKPSLPSLPRRLTIFKADLETYGYTDACPKCNLYRAGADERAGV